MMLYIDANKLYGYAKSESLPYDEIKFDKNIKLEDILNTPDDSDIGSFVDVDLNHSDKIKEKIKNFPLLLKRKKLTRSILLGKRMKRNRKLIHNVRR